MVDTKKRNLRQYTWQKENAERISFIMPIGTKDKIKEAARLLDVSASEFIRTAIKEKIDSVSGL